MKDKIMEYKGYTAESEYSTEDNVYYGKLQDIDDVVLFDGKSLNELELSFHAAVDDYLSCKYQFGKCT